MPEEPIIGAIVERTDILDRARFMWSAGQGLKDVTDPRFRALAATVIAVEQSRERRLHAAAVAEAFNGLLPSYEAAMERRLRRGWLSRLFRRGPTPAVAAMEAAQELERLMAILDTIQRRQRAESAAATLGLFGLLVGDREVAAQRALGVARALLPEENARRLHVDARR